MRSATAPGGEAAGFSAGVSSDVIQVFRGHVPSFVAVEAVVGLPCPSVGLAFFAGAEVSRIAEVRNAAGARGGAGGHFWTSGCQGRDPIKLRQAFFATFGVASTFGVVWVV